MWNASGWAVLAVVILLTGCQLPLGEEAADGAGGSGSGSSPGRTEFESDAAGGVASIAGSARFYPWNTHDLYSPANLSGYVDLHAGPSSFSVPASGFDFFNHYYLDGPFEVDVPADGPVPVFLFSELHYSDPPIFDGPVGYAGVALVDAVPGQTTNMYTGIPELDWSEYQDFYVPLEVNEELSLSGPPEIYSFEVDSTSVSDPFVVVSGDIGEVDIAVAALRVNNRYLLVVWDEYGGGTAGFEKVVNLLPGTNDIQLTAVSSMGTTISTSRTVRFTPPDGPGPDLYTSVTWDWPASNMDLFVWYFDTSSPDGSSEARWLAESRNSDIPGAPDAVGTGLVSGGGVIGHTNGSEVSFLYDASPAVLSFVLDGETGSYELSVSDAGNVVFDLEGAMGRSRNGWNGTDSGSFDLGVPTMATGFFASGGFGFASPTDVTATIDVVVSEEGLATGTINLTGEEVDGIPATDFSLSFIDAVMLHNAGGSGAGSGDVVNPYANMNITNAGGYGPELFTLYDAPDGYYVFAVASVDMDEPEHFPNSLLHSRVFVSAHADGELRNFMPHWFETHASDSLTRQNAPESYWYRPFDLRVRDGRVTYLRPATDLNLPGYPDLAGLR